MTPLVDVTLAPPLPEPLFRALLFFLFALHFAFALLTIGTAVLAVATWARKRTGRGPVDPEPPSLLRAFFIEKSLAISLGVAPLLLVQAQRSVPFLTAVNLLAPLWMGLVVLLLAALALLEGFERRVEHGGRAGWLGVAGVAAILAVPAVFAAVLATSERPEAWAEALRRGAMPAALGVHWLFRWLHVLGAAVLAASALEYLRAPVAMVARRSLLASWIAGAIAYQAALGAALLATVRPAPGPVSAAPIVVGVAIAGWLLWRATRLREGALPGGREVLALATATVVAMLLGRQLLQDRRHVPLQAALAEGAAAYRAALAPGRPAALARYDASVQVRTGDALTRYDRSCKFCHGAVANGDGPERVRLAVPPEDLSQLRLSRAELQRILRDGVPGTAMPSFGFYTADALDGIAALLVKTGFREDLGLLRLPPIGDAARATAVALWTSRCSTCHGAGGEGSPLSAGFSPRPPDLRRLTLAPQRAFSVLTAGYPGTLMPSFAAQPDEVRWALVEKVTGLFRRP